MGAEADAGVGAGAALVVVVVAAFLGEAALAGGSAAAFPVEPASEAAFPPAAALLSGLTVSATAGADDVPLAVPFAVPDLPGVVAGTLDGATAAEALAAGEPLEDAPLRDEPSPEVAVPAALAAVVRAAVSLAGL